MTFITAFVLYLQYLCIVLIEEVVLKHRLGQKIKVVTDLLKLADPKAAKADTGWGVNPLSGRWWIMLFGALLPSEEMKFISLGFEKD